LHHLDVGFYNEQANGNWLGFFDGY